MSETIVMMPGDTIMKQGDPSNSIFLLQSGTLNVFVAKDGKPQKVGTIQEGQIVGEMAFICNQPRSATIIAATKCELVQVSLETFQKGLNQNPIWMQEFIRTLMDRLKSANQR